MSERAITSYPSESAAPGALSPRAARRSTPVMRDPELGAWSEEILGARHEAATERFCRMMRDGRDLGELLQHAITATAPYLHVPSHVRVKNGEMSLVNYNVIRSGSYTPRERPVGFEGARALKRRSPEATLAELDIAIEAQEGDRVVALMRSYLDAGAPIEPLKTVLVLGMAKFQNDPHQQRFCGSTVEEAEESGIEGAWMDHLMALANYGARSSKRSTNLACYELYRRYFLA
jgi:hypothetical protein